MKIKFLKAGSGDSILIQHNSKNIVIDGGNDSKSLISEVDKIIQANQVIDLLIVTHHDDDHIKGIIELVKYIDKHTSVKCSDFFKEVLFNSPNKILQKKDKNNYLSYKQAFDLEELLVKNNINWNGCNEESNSIEFDGLVLNFLSPTRVDLESYAMSAGAYLTSDFKSDWESPLHKLDKHINDDSLDVSNPNRSSVVIMIRCEEKQILLPGDVTPNRLDEILHKLIGTATSFNFDLIKLPHHGSYRSLSETILKKINCNNFVISANGKKKNLPNKRTFLKIFKYMDRSNKKTVNFLFNYNEVIDCLNITDKEKREYNFTLTPSTESYGINY